MKKRRKIYVQIKIWVFIRGALYENFVAEAFLKQGLGLYYYKKENATLEEDFFCQDKR
ncbi:MAG: DUF4143 domain-containing protein [Ruminococcus sp.]